MIYGQRYDPYIKRLPSRKDYTSGIQTFDIDNLYPQKAKEIVGRSFTLKGVIEKLSGFTNGEGFTDPSINQLITSVDAKTGRSVTAQECLDKLSYDFSLADGFALHVTYDLNYKISAIRKLNFEFCRHGIVDADGDSLTVAYSTNWEQDWNKGPRVVTHYPIFNPDRVREEIEACGGIFNYKGQILYWTPEESQYPKATFDPVFDQAQVQSEIGISQLADIQNGFSAGHLFFYPGTFDDDTQRSDFKTKLNMHRGAAGQNSIMVVEGASPDTDFSKLIVKTDLQNNDKIREFTSKDVKNAIMECYGLPKPILGMFPETGMFNQQEILDAYDYANTVTSDRRKVMERIFYRIFSYWKTPVNLSGLTINPQRYLSSTVAPGAAPAQQQQAGQPGSPQASEKSSVDQIIRSLSRRDVARIFSYIKDYQAGRTTIDQARIFLLPFLQTQENVDSFLKDPEGDGI